MEAAQNAEKKKGKTPTKSKEFIEEEEESEEEETDYEPSESESSASGTSGEESEAEEIVEKKKATSLKRKRKEKDSTKEKKGKKAKADDQPMQNEGEIKFKPEQKEEENVGKKKGKGKIVQAVLPNFESGKVDKNLFSEDPNNIITKTVQINTGLKLSCKMISGVTVSSSKTQYPDWAALIFQKKIKDNKVFEFNVNLKDAPKIIEAIKFIMAENPTFFNV